MKRAILGLTIICLLAAAAGAEDFRDLNENGNRAFENGNFEEALDFYHQAEIEKPETPEIYYNQANALLKSGQYEEAIEKFDRVLNTSDMRLQANAYYNQGSAQFLKGDYMKAIEAFEKVLELYPDDMEAKYNLELARNRLKEQMERQQEDQNQGQSDDQQQQQQQQQQEQEQEQQDEQQKQQQEQQEQPQEGEEEDSKQDEQQQQQQEQQPQPKPDEMSEEDAMRILNALEDEEKDNQKNRKKIKIPTNYRGKDW